MEVSKPVETVPRRVYDSHIHSLTERAIEAEECVQALITLIADDDGEFLASHGYDWKAATEALCQP